MKLLKKSVSILIAVIAVVVLLPGNAYGSISHTISFSVSDVSLGKKNEYDTVAMYGLQQMSGSGNRKKIWKT